MGSHIERALTAHLKTILQNDVEYDEDEAEDNENFLWDAISGLISTMVKLDPLFAEVYQQVVHAGSYWEELRITSATEFDIQMVLEFPFPAESVTISLPSPDSPFVTYKLNQPPKQVLNQKCEQLEPYKKLATFFDKNWFLSSHAVRTWVHQLTKTAFESKDFVLPKSVSEMTIKSQSSTCPAFTFEITGANSGETIDVDLVPVLDTSDTRIPSEIRDVSPRFRNLLHNEESIQWFLVPKPSTDSSPNILWRNAFPSAEKQLLNETGCLRDMIKIFKLLRDLHGNWRKPIFSYVLKSFFLIEFDKNPNLDYWSDSNLGQVFLKSLEKFQKAMESRRILYYFNRKANMIDNINPKTAKNISGRVKNIIHLLRQNPDNIRDIFCQED